MLQKTKENADGSGRTLAVLTLTEGHLSDPCHLLHGYVIPNQEKQKSPVAEGS